MFFVWTTASMHSFAIRILPNFVIRYFTPPPYSFPLSNYLKLFVCPLKIFVIRSINKLSYFLHNHCIMRRINSFHKAINQPPHFLFATKHYAFHVLTPKINCPKGCKSFFLLSFSLIFHKRVLSLLRRLLSKTYIASKFTPR